MSETNGVECRLQLFRGRDRSRHDRDRRRRSASASSPPRAAEGIARQPSAADKITGAVNLPLFLLEGVAILAEVFVLLIVLLK